MNKAVVASTVVIVKEYWPFLKTLLVAGLVFLMLAFVQAYQDSKRTNQNQAALIKFVADTTRAGVLAKQKEVVRTQWVRDTVVINRMIPSLRTQVAALPEPKTIRVTDTVYVREVVGQYSEAVRSCLAVVDSMTVAAARCRTMVEVSDSTDKYRVGATNAATDYAGLKPQSAWKSAIVKIGKGIDDKKWHAVSFGLGVVVGRATKN